MVNMKNTPQKRTNLKFPDSFLLNFITNYPKRKEDFLCISLATPLPLLGKMLSAGCWNNICILAIR